MEWCQQNDEIIMNTRFNKHQRSLWTWKSPDGITRNQIDYIKVNRRYRNTVNDFHTHPEADCSIVSNPSVSNEHLFMLGDFNINLYSYTPTCDFVGALLSQHFLSYIIHPTRVSVYSTIIDIIDIIFSNICNINTISGNILTQVTEHFPQFLIARKAGIASRRQSYYQLKYSNVALPYRSTLSKMTVVTMDFHFFLSLASFVTFSILISAASLSPCM